MHWRDRLTEALGPSMTLMAPACKRCQISWTATYTIVATAAIAAMTSKMRCSKRHISIWELTDDSLGLSKAGPFRVFCGVPADRHGFVVAGYARGSDLRPKGVELPVMLRGEPHVLAWWHAPCLWEVKLLVALNPRRESCGRSSGDTYPSAISYSSWPIDLFLQSHIWVQNCTKPIGRQTGPTLIATQIAEIQPSCRHRRAAQRLV